MAAKTNRTSKQKTAGKKRPGDRRSSGSRQERVPADGPYAIHEVMALALAGVCAMFLLALVSYSPDDLPGWVPFSTRAGPAGDVGNFIGPVGAVAAGYGYFFLGAASYFVPAVLAWWAIQVLTGARAFHVRNLFSLVALVVSAACLVEFQPFFFEDWTGRYNLPRSAGGIVGYGFGREVVARFLGPVGSVIVTAIVYAIALIVITGIHPFRFAVMMKEGIVRSWEHLRENPPRFDKLRRPVRASAWAAKSKSPASAASGSRSDAKKKRASDSGTGQPRQGELFEQPEPKQKAGTRKAAAQQESQPETAAPEPKIIDSSQPSRRKLSQEEAAGSLFDKSEKQSVVLSGRQFEDYELPSLSLLHHSDDSGEPTDQNELLQQQHQIVNTLSTFGVDVEPGDITKGPTITRYEVYPKPGLRVSKITALQADLARATRAERINILAPVPGKDTVGIELANSNRVAVALRELFEDEAFRESKAKLPLALGRDVYGRTVIGDLAHMPHLLVAGATGSGKSVCINSIVASLLYRFTPDELRFIMIDPKVVEMQLYNDLPHMVVPVVTDPKKVLLALRWVINEMERRYALFAKVGTRNFEGYNAMRARDLAREKAAAEEAAVSAEGEESAAEEASQQSDAEGEGASPFATEAEAPAVAGSTLGEEPELVHHVKLSDALEAEGGFPAEDGGGSTAPNSGAEPASGGGEEEDLPENLPYIVVIIDELADLMQTAASDVETGIARIAQKARAAGIHLIVATQTPRADVVTGIIKANVPSRIAFQVSSKTDSRIILDANGAENLVGQGDMLYLPPGQAQLVRSQGALITEEEAQDLVDACASQAEPKFEPEAREAIESGDGPEEDEEISDADEETLQRCLEVVCSEKKASTSLLQRRLRLGYTRAARMIDILEARGIIGPGDGAKPREILVDVSDDVA